MMTAAVKSIAVMMTVMMKAAMTVAMMTSERTAYAIPVAATDSRDSSRMDIMISSSMISKSNRRYSSIHRTEIFCLIL